MSPPPMVSAPSRSRPVVIFIAISLVLLAAGYGYYRSETEAEARYRAALISSLVASLVLLAGAATAYVYRHRQAQLFRELYASERLRQESMRLFRATLYSIGDAVITTDRKGLVREMNPAAEAMTGWFESEARGEPLEQVFHIIDEDTRATVANPVEKVFNQGSVAGLANHTLLLARDGRERPITDSAAPIREDDGSLSGVVLVFSDRTHERETQKALRMSEQRLRAIIETEPECVKVVDRNGKLLEMNTAGLAMLEADSLKDVQDRGLMDFIQADFQAAFRGLHERVMRGESGTLEFKVTGLRGSKRWLETHAAPLRDGKGQVSMLLGITRDITNRKAAEAALLQRSRQLAVLSQASQIVNAVLETPTVMRQLVATALELTGATDGAAALLQDGRMVFQEYHLHGKLMAIELAFERGQGVPGWVLQTRAPYLTNDAEHDPHVLPDIRKALGFNNLADIPVINRQGDLLGCFEIHNKPGGFNGTDILMLQGLAASAAVALENAELLTERKRAEEALLQQEAELHAAQRIAHVGSWRLDNATNKVFWTEELYRMFGLDPRYPPPNYTEHQRLFTSESWKRLSAALATTQETGTPYELELEMVRPGKVSGWMLAFGEPSRDSDGAIVGLRGAAQDITERKQAKAALQESEERFRTLAEWTPDPFCVHRDGKFIYVNPAAVKMVGAASAQDLLGQPILDRVHPDFRPIVLERLKQAPGHDGRIPLLEEKFLKMDGTVIDVEVQATTIIYDGAPAAHVAIRDITARKQADEALHRSLREKEALLKEVHHRVKNNLQVITSLLRLEAGRSQQQGTKSVLLEMQNRIRSMALLHESLYRSKNLEQVDLPAYIKQLTTHLFRSMLAKPGSIQLELELAPVSLPLEQAVPCGLLVNELVSNCLKHAFPDGGPGKIRIELQSVDDGQSIRLRVSDTGVGLPADFKEKSATSLGLQLVSDLARQLKGKLETGGGTGVGAVFEVIFEAPPAAT